MSRADDETSVSVEHLEHITVLSIHLGAASGDDFDALVTEPVVSTVEALRWEREHDAARNIAIVQIDDDSTPAHLSEALLEALRGVCGSLTLESSGSDGRVNLLRAASRADADPTLRFLATSPAGFVAGSTIDLKNRSAR